MTNFVPSWMNWRSTLFVYVMKSGDLRKIGVTIDPYRRLAEVQREVGEGVDLEFMASHPVQYLQRIEAATHLELSAKRVHGEWFSVSYPEAEVAILRCLAMELHGDNHGHLLADYAGFRDAVVAKAEGDLEAMQERDIGFIILNGPPTGMTATQRLCAFLDWRYGTCSGKDVSQKHGVSKSTLVRCFGDRLSRVKSNQLQMISASDLRRMFGGLGARSASCPDDCSTYSCKIGVIRKLERMNK